MYRIRRAGEKLHPDDVRLVRVTGDLRFGYRMLRGQLKIMKAQLLAEDGATYVIPVLDRARLVKIEGNGILLTGIEIIPITKGIKNIKSVDYPQSWYCIPAHLDRPLGEPLSPARGRAFSRREQEQAEERRRAEKIGASMNNMYARRRG